MSALQRSIIGYALRKRVVSGLAAGVLAFGLAGPLLLAPGAAWADRMGAWIPTWTASPQPLMDDDFFAAPGIPRSLRDQTVRQVARVSLGGKQIRLVFSNEFGTKPLVLSSVHVAAALKDGAIDTKTDKAVTFAGKSEVSVPPGAPMLSDPVDIEVSALSELSVSVYLPNVTPLTTWHNDARQTAYVSGNGNFTAEDSFKPATTFPSRVFLSKILVSAAPGERAVVAFGDSITDGDGSTPDHNTRWPDALAERLVKAGAPVAVLNQGISGDRVLRDQLGTNALSRFDRDVLSQPGADTVIVMMGINDIGWPGSALVPQGEPAPTADDIIAGYKQLIDRAHANDFKIIGATLTPFEDAFKGTPLSQFYDPAKEVKRQALNTWIRTSGAFDAVIDFDAVVRDPANPKRIRKDFDRGDNLHPNDAGYKAMAGAIDLQVLGVK